MAGPLPVSQFPSYSTVGNLLGTELLYLGVANVAPYKLTTLQLQTLYPASTSIAGTETIVTTTAGNTIQKTTIAQLVSQLTAAGNPAAADLFFSEQSGNPRKMQLSEIAAFSNIYTGGGTGTANTVTMSPVPSAYYTGMMVCWIPASTNAFTCSLNVNGLGAVSIFAYGAACIGGELQPNTVAVAIHDGTRFNLLNPFTQSELTIFTANGNFTPKTAGTYFIMGIGGGGGGGGGGGSTTTAGGSGGQGGSGGVFGFTTATLTSGLPVAVTIGTAGTAGTAGAASGNGGGGGAGGATTFGATTIGAGGAGGSAGRASQLAGGSSTAGSNGGGNGGGQGGAAVAGTNTPGNAGTAAAVNTGGGGGGGSGGGTTGVAQVGGAGGAGGTGILIIRRA